MVADDSVHDSDRLVHKPIAQVREPAISWLKALKILRGRRYTRSLRPMLQPAFHASRRPRCLP